MNYWLGVGLLVFVVGVWFYVASRGASAHIKRHGVEGSRSPHEIGGILLGYALPLLGIVCIVIGVVQTSQ